MGNALLIINTCKYVKLKPYFDKNRFYSLAVKFKSFQGEEIEIIFYDQYLIVEL